MRVPRRRPVGARHGGVDAASRACSGLAAAPCVDHWDLVLLHAPTCLGDEAISSG